MDIKIIKICIQMMDMEETDQLAKANSVCWHDHVLRKDNNYMVRKVLREQREREEIEDHLDTNSGRTE